MRAVTLLLLTLGLSACSLLYPTYSIDVVVENSRYYRFFLKVTVNAGLPRGFFDAVYINFILVGTETADPYLHDIRFLINVYPRQAYKVEFLHPNLVRLGEQVRLRIRINTAITPSPPDRQVVYVHILGRNTRSRIITLLYELYASGIRVEPLVFSQESRHG